ncbi:MAG: hypothetical protein ACOX17_01825 [Christensenellales bacterium]|jgi:hypothetical protein
MERKWAIDYNRLRMIYITSDKSLRELAEEAGISYSRLREISGPEGWFAQRNRYRREIADKLIAYRGAREVRTVKTAMRAMDRLAREAENLLREENPFEKTALTRRGMVVRMGTPDYNAMRAYAAGMKSIVDAFVALYPMNGTKDRPEGAGVVEMPTRRKPKPPEGEGDG